MQPLSLAIRWRAPFPNIGSLDAGHCSSANPNLSLVCCALSVALSTNNLRFCIGVAPPAPHPVGCTDGQLHCCASRLSTPALRSRRDIQESISTAGTAWSHTATRRLLTRHRDARPVARAPHCVQELACRAHAVPASMSAKPRHDADSSPPPAVASTCAAPRAPLGHTLGCFFRHQGPTAYWPAPQMVAPWHPLLNLGAKHLYLSRKGCLPSSAIAVTGSRILGTRSSYHTARVGFSHWHTSFARPKRRWG